MAQEADRLVELSQAVRESTLKRLVRVPHGTENWRPVEGALSFADLAQHLIDSDEWLFAKLENPDLLAIDATPGCVTITERSQFEAMIERLRELGRRREEVIGAMSEVTLATPLPDDRFGGEATIWWIVARGSLDHEAHHRGQLAAYLRIHSG